MRTQNLNKVLERMGLTENTTLNVRREEGGKIRVTSNLWNFEKVILKGEVLEVRNVDGRLLCRPYAALPERVGLAD